MIEVEIKLPLYKRSLTEHHLMEYGFTAGDLVRESDWYFTSEFHDFMARDEALRLRSIENMTRLTNQYFLTYKGPKLDTVSMARQEIETALGDLTAARAVFKALGYRELAPVIKLRQHYHLRDLTACVDQVKGLGSFLELEILAEKEKDREPALARIEEVLCFLGFTLEDTTTVSYLGMLLRKKGFLPSH